MKLKLSLLLLLISFTAFTSTAQTRGWKSMTKYTWKLDSIRGGGEMDKLERELRREQDFMMMYFAKEKMIINTSKGIIALDYELVKGNEPYVLLRSLVMGYLEVKSYSKEQMALEFRAGFGRKSLNSTIYFSSTKEDIKRPVLKVEGQYLYRQRTYYTSENGRRRRKTNKLELELLENGKMKCLLNDKQEEGTWSFDKTSLTLELKGENANYTFNVLLHNKRMLLLEDPSAKSQEVFEFKRNTYHFKEKYNSAEEVQEEAVEEIEIESDMPPPPPPAPEAREAPAEEMVEEPAVRHSFPGSDELWTSYSIDSKTKDQGVWTFQFKKDGSAIISSVNNKKTFKGTWKRNGYRSLPLTLDGMEQVVLFSRDYSRRSNVNAKLLTLRLPGEKKVTELHLKVAAN